MSFVASLPEIVLPDGVAALPYYPSVVLVTDAAKGIIWRVNTATGHQEKVIDDPLFKPTEAVPLGVNGIHVLDDQLYFTNLATNLVGRLKITITGDAAGPVQTVTTSALLADDFALADEGTVYVAGFNTLWKVASDGGTIAVAGGPNSTTVQGITSARFGRTVLDHDVLYMATEGGVFNDPPGSEVHGGQLLAVNMRALD